MNIHEYQAKRLLHEYGAPIANGVAVYSVEQAEKWAKNCPGHSMWLKVRFTLVVVVKGSLKN